MVRKIISILLCCSLLCVLPIHAGAASTSDGGEEKIVSSRTIAVKDGFVVETISTRPDLTRAGGTFVDKRWDYTTSWGVEWTYTITGYFSWNGVSATASNPSDKYEIIYDGWKCTKHSVRTAGPSIVGNATFKYFTLTEIADPVLTCSVNGEFT